MAWILFVYAMIDQMKFFIITVLGNISCLLSVCLDSAQSTARIEELLLEDQNVKRRRERYQKQSSLLSKLTRQLSIHDNRATAASSWSNGVGGAGMKWEVYEVYASIASF